MYASLADLNIALFRFWKKDKIVHDRSEERNTRRIISTIVLNVIYVAVIHRPESRLKRKQQISKVNAQYRNTSNGNRIQREQVW